MVNNLVSRMNENMVVREEKKLERELYDGVVVSAWCTRDTLTTTDNIVRFWQTDCSGTSGK